MTAIAQELDHKLHQWRPEIVRDVEHMVAEIITWADANAFDVMRPREIEQQVLDILDDSKTQ